MRKKHHLLLTAVFLGLAIGASAQVSVHDGSGNDPNASSMLDVQADDSGVLIPRLTQAQRNAIASPATSLLIYQTDNTTGYYYNSGTPGSPVWERLALTSGTVSGSGVSTRVAFWNTATALSSNADLHWDNGNQRLGVGTASPAARLHVDGLTYLFNGVNEDLRIGRNANEYLSIEVQDVHAYIDYEQDADENQGHTLFLRNNAGGTGENDIRLHTGGADRLTVQRNGNVGIGTVGPAQRLHVQGGNLQVSNAADDNRVTVFTNTANYPRIGNYYSSAHTFSMESLGNVQVVLDHNNNTPDRDFLVRTGGTTGAIRLTVKGQTGNVGIGSNAPISKLTVSSADFDDHLIIQRSGAPDGHFSTSTGGWMQVWPGTSGEYTSKGIRMNNSGTVQLMNYTANGILKTMSGNGTLAIATGADLPSHTHPWSQVTAKPAAWLDAANLIESLSNFNHSRPSGFYQGSNATNAPGGSWYNMLNVRHSNTGNDHGFQIAASYYDENIWTRTYRSGTGNDDGTFTAWRSLVHSGNISSNAILNQTAQQPSSNFNISGNGTMAGNARVDGNDGVEVRRGLHGGYNNSAPGSGNWGANIWTIGPSWQGSGYGTGFVVGGGQYGLTWLRQSHPSVNSISSEGLHIYRAGNLAAAIGYLGAHFMHRVVIDGSVGIGTTSLTSKLVVDGGIGRTAHNNGHLEGSYNNVGANSARSNPIYTIGTNYNPSADALGNMYGIGYTHTNATFVAHPGGSNSWGMYVAADGDARIWFGATSGAHSYFNTGGNVGIGTSTPTAKLFVNGNIRTNAINETSDERLKKDVKGLEGALQKVAEMRGVTYHWRTDEFPDRDFDKGLQYGLIAQELEKVIPELVHTDSDGWKSIEYSHLVPLLIEAVKEQQLLNERLAERVERQQGQIDACTATEARLTKLEEELVRITSPNSDQKFGNQVYDNSNDN